MSKSKQNLLFVAGVFGGMIVAAVVAWALYRSMNPEVLAAAPAPVQQAAAAPEEFARISAAELKALVDRGAVTVIDVRDLDAFGASHIAGALQIPLARIEGEIPYLPRDKPIVTYCTCPAEESSGQAAMILARGGIAGVRALHGGLGAWTAAGHPTESGVNAPKV